jgi:hypothetical protein
MIDRLVATDPVAFPSLTCSLSYHQNLDIGSVRPAQFEEMRLRDFHQIGLAADNPLGYEKISTNRRR